MHHPSSWQHSEGERRTPSPVSRAVSPPGSPKPRPSAFAANTSAAPAGRATVAPTATQLALGALGVVFATNISIASEGFARSHLVGGLAGLAAAVLSAAAAASAALRAGAAQGGAGGFPNPKSAALRMFLGKRAPLCLAIPLLMACAAADAHLMASGGTRIWLAYPLLAKAFAAMRIPARDVRLICAFALLLLTLLQAESAFRLGLLEAPGFPPQDGRRERSCGCTDLPCAGLGHATVATILTPLACLVLESCFCIASATRLLPEGELDSGESLGYVSSAGPPGPSLEETLRAILPLMCKFHLKEADVFLAEAAACSASPLMPPSGGGGRVGGMPEDVHQLVLQVLHTLGVCQQYLPLVVREQFEASDGWGGQGEDTLDSLLAGPAGPAEPAPGGDAGVAIVFTDIRGSTALWEQSPEVMQASLHIHDTRIRKVIAWCHGYEVKTIGDSFMVAFASAIPAVNFGLLVHEQLLSAPWPSELFQFPHCATDASGAWGGLSVRIGVHCGPVSQRKNEVTHRVDYFGQTVNKAARLESVCVPGSVAVSAEVFEELETARRADQEEDTASISKSLSAALQSISHVLPFQGTSPASSACAGGLQVYPVIEPVKLTSRESFMGLGINTPLEYVSLPLGITELRGMASGRALLLLSWGLRGREDVVRSALLYNKSQKSSGNPPALPQGLNTAGSQPHLHPHRSQKSISRNGLLVSCLSDSPRSSVGGVFSRKSTAMTLSRQGGPGDSQRQRLSSSTPVYVQRVLEKLCDFTSVPRATVGRVEVTYPAGDDISAVLNTAFSTCVTCLQRTSGTLTSVLGSSVCAGWNTVKPLATHVESSFRFLCLVKRASSLWPGDPECAGVQTHFGLATGPVSCGTVGNSTQRFHTVVGPGVNLSWTLSGTARDEGQQGLYGSLSEDVTVRWEPSKRCCLRPFDDWALPGHGMLQVYELSMESVSRSRLMQKAAIESEDGSGGVAEGWESDPRTIDSASDNSTLIKCSSSMQSVGLLLKMRSCEVRGGHRLSSSSPAEIARQASMQ